MKLSTRSTYGMRALVEIALASSHGPVSAAFISKRHNLSVAYLEQLLHRLKKEDLVTSIRGPRGGYRLAKEPHLITMSEVVKVLDGINGVSVANGNGDYQHAEQVAQAVSHCVHERLAQSLDTVTLQDLIDEVRVIAGEPLEHRYVFHI